MTKVAIPVTHPAFGNDPGPSIFDRFQYSPAVRAGNLVFVAGQVGINPDGSIPSDAETQITRAFERLAAILDAAGCKAADLVELVSYHVGLRNQLADFRRIKEAFVPAPFPAWTILEVAGLARPELLVEIKAVAHAPGR